ncbi:hypothetical protein JR316_0004521 [Psilocybe cubensis]|uniref:Uncharacterized protein n=1 Tax=Psilocybe cubensis TaxID=181762 RepID=A0ACB8H3G6_PSICU|nr:hypothetical protein JR316_0004521 [Psilocybe cubensis]KAH9482421.1 hypothetical protein JR316_0004521 [Psilocybe cubensis]
MTLIFAYYLLFARQHVLTYSAYQIHQEATFQQAVVRNLNDKNAQLQKQFDNVVREAAVANGELNLLNSKKAGLRDYLPPKQIVDCVNVTELERDLELERRKVRELQDAARERDKEYAKLKAQLDKFKRKTLLGPASGNENATPAPNSFFDDQRTKPRQTGNTVANVSSVNSVVGGMESNGSSPPSQTNGQPEDFVPLFQDSK